MKKRNQIIFSSLLGIILLAVIFIPKETKEPIHIENVEEVDSLEAKEYTYKYGIPMDDYEVEFGTIKRNQTMSVVLSQYNVNLQQSFLMAQKSKGVFDIRKMRVGQPFALFMKKDSMRTPEFFVYEVDARSYVVFDMRDTMSVSMGQNPVEWYRKEIRGTVESSLWNAMVACEASPILAIDLSQIFGWTIDFFGLQREDEFRVIYEQECVDGVELPNMHILAASFLHRDSLYYAIPFEQDGEELYFNEHGNSLEGAFLRAPLDYFRITSRFTNSRYHPVLKRYRAHHGVDYAAPVGTPVYAIGSGTVIAKGYQANGGGNYVKIRHNTMYTTSYMHLKGFAKGLRVGTQVAQKEVIGYVGSTGLSTGPHLDFRVYEHGKPINPLTVKSQPKAPVKPENLQTFTLLRDSVIRELQKIEKIQPNKPVEIDSTILP